MKTVFALNILPSTGNALKLDSVCEDEKSGMAFASTRAIAHKYGEPIKIVGDTKLVRYVWRSPLGYISQTLEEMPLLGMSNYL